MTRSLIVSMLAAIPLAASATLFTEDFDVDNSANWQINTSHASGSFGDAFFDYSTVGIPSAPRSRDGSTRGLKMEANVPGTGVFSGMSASPIGQSFTGDYEVVFDMWQNFVGPFPAGGSGSTQMSMGGIGAPTTQVQFPGTTYTGVGFAASGDGGSASDYRAYNRPGAPFADTSGVYAAGNTAGSTNNTNAYYSSFGGVSAPAAQLALFPQQTGATNVGSQGMAWHTWRIKKTGSTVTWSVDGLLIATVTNATFGGDNLFFGQFDINTTSSTDVNARNLQFGLVDNIEVVPEPATMLTLGMGAALLARRRRRA